MKRLKRSMPLPGRVVDRRAGPPARGPFFVEKERRGRNGFFAFLGLCSVSLIAVVLVIILWVWR